MPPKKKGGKKAGKKVGAVEQAPDPNAGLTPEQLQTKLRMMKDELEKEREERNYFQLERDKINTFWEITKKQLEESRATLRNKDREMEEAEEKHAIEIKVYKQKVKHLLYEHQNQITELKTDATMNLRVAADSFKQDSDFLRRDKRDLKVGMKETELAHISSIKQLQVEYDKKMTELYEQNQQSAKEIRQKYEQMMDALRNDMELQRKTEIHEIEERKNQQISTLVHNHEKAFSDIKNYYNDITLNNLALINSLKEKVEDMKKKEERIEKAMAEITQENKHLVEPLKAAQSRVAELEKHLAHHDRDKQFLRNAKARIKVLEDEVKSLEWEKEVLQQRFQEVEEERDELYERFVKTIYDVQQKTGFKNLILEKKLDALSDQLEKKEAQLNEVLSASNLDPTALAVVTRKLEDVLDSKNGAIKDLQYELAKSYKSYNDTVLTFKSKLEEYGIPVDELGVKLINPDPDQPLGKAPAGLVSTA
eukprot:m.130269 g.130269  ORF g.130269 m.130269 type:complete len:479 (+) comp9467_c0_seq21:57-1493(+)